MPARITKEVIFDWGGETIELIYRFCRVLRGVGEVGMFLQDFLLKLIVQIKGGP